MPRPNLAQDAPPDKLVVGGVSYAVNVDFRVWIDVLERLRGLCAVPNSPERALRNAGILAEVETAVFGRVIPAEPVQVLDAVAGFAAGYPEAPVGEAGPDAPVYSFGWDLNYIVIAVMNQFGIDLSYRRKEPFHFWEFLLYFRALCGDHYILRLMEIRSYDGKDPVMKRQAQRYALPREDDEEDRAVLAAFDEMFFNS